jgi:hypothetical protein
VLEIVLLEASRVSEFRCFLRILTLRADYIVSGHSLLDAVTRANKVAAISVQRRGTQTSYPHLKELPAELQ